MLRGQRWLWRAVEPIWNGAFRRASATNGHPATVNREVMRLEYDYAARYDRSDKQVYEPVFYGAVMDRLRDGFTFLDIGAHIGVFSIGGARRVGRSGKVLAFEPAPVTLGSLRNHVRFNRLENSIEVVPAPVSDTEREISFYSFGESMSASVSRENVEILNPQRRSGEIRSTEMRVRAVTLDGLLATRGVRPDVIKIDIEGAELHALRGARRVLHECRPLILCEIHPLQMQNCGSSVDAFGAYLAEVRYSSTQLDAPNYEGIYHALLAPKQAG